MSKFKDFIKKEKRDIESFEFNSDSLKIAGDWPLTIKASITIISVILLLIASTQLYFKSNFNENEKLIKEESTLTKLVLSKITQSSGIDTYNKNIEDMNESFKTLLSKLPTEIEMDGLLNDITKTGIANGIEFKNIQMMKESSSDYYVEYPIEITVLGTYHSLGQFISDISNLSRIVTFHDFQIKESTTEKFLEIKMLAKTYKYQEKVQDVPVVEVKKKRGSK